MLKIYKASAGSGKTYTLAYEYIRTLLGVKKQQSGTYRLNHRECAPDGSYLSHRHRHILAITFTNKATEEMKKRIINELDSLSFMPGAGESDSDYAPKLCREFGCDRRQLAESASLALDQLLDTYTDFNVTTIDSFFQRVLRTFARELDRQGDFAIEINDRTALQMTVNTMLDDFNRNPEQAPALRQWLIDFMMSSVDDGSKSNFLNRSSSLYSRLIDLATQICDEKFKPYSAAMRKYLGVGDADGGSPARLADTVDRLRRICSRIPAELSARVDAMWSDFAADGITPEMLAGRAVSTRFLTDILPGKKVPKYSDLQNKKLIDTINGEAMPFTKSRFKGNDTHIERVRQELDHAVRAYYRYYDYQTLLKALPQLSLLAYAWRYLDSIITDNNTVLLSDTNHLLHRIIGADETPFIYERMGVNLTNFLIDEFQDTSKMQWMNLKPLVAESLGHDHDNLIIGDEKQSIYRFRNSDSSLLHTQVADVDFPVGAGYDTRVEGDRPGQNTNWRSAADMVRFNNTLFTLLASHYGVEGYDNVIQQIAPKKADVPGYVRFINTGSREVPEDADLDKEHEEAPDVITSMAGDMRRQHDDGHYDWSDIAVLVNRNVEGAQVIEQLSALGIPVVSSDSMLLRKSTAVMMVVSVLRIYAESHSNRKVTVRKGNIYPDTSQTAAIISQYKYLRQRGMPPYQAIVSASDTALADGNPAAEVVGRLMKHRPSSLVSLIETIILEFVDEEDRARQSAYLAAFEDFAIEWSEKYPPSLPGFLEAWESQKDKLSVTSSSEIDAVSVITIHKSKGLEYDCVHIPFGSWREAGREYRLWMPFPVIGSLQADDCPPAVFVELSARASHPSSIFYDTYTERLREEYVDNLNKTYVAYTRAGRELTVYYDAGKDIGKTLKSVFDTGNDPQGNTCLLSLHDDAEYDTATGDLTIGAPTVKIRPEIKKTRHPDKPGTESLGGYGITVSREIDIRTIVDDNLDDALDIGADADDTRGYSADDFIDEESRLRGIALHDIISRVIVADDAEAAVRYHVMRNDVSADDETALLADIKAMLSTAHPGPRRWFASDADVLTEQTIYSPHTGKSRRLDRVVRYPDGSVDIIDYKFTTAHRSEHRRQVAGYMSRLRTMGFTDVRGYLWYPLIAPDDIIEIRQ